LIVERKVEAEISAGGITSIRLGLEDHVFGIVHPGRRREVESDNGLEVEAFDLLLLGR
jgi:hypothetical protein